MNPVLQRNREKQRSTGPKIEQIRNNKIRDNCKTMISECLNEDKTFSGEAFQEIVGALEQEIYTLSGENENSKPYRDLINNTKGKLKGLKNKNIRSHLLSQKLSVQDFLNQELSQLQNLCKEPEDQAKQASPKKQMGPSRPQRNIRNPPSMGNIPRPPFNPRNDKINNQVQPSEPTSQKKEVETMMNQNQSNINQAQEEKEDQKIEKDLQNSDQKHQNDQNEEIRQNEVDNEQKIQEDQNEPLKDDLLDQKELIEENIQEQKDIIQNQPEQQPNENEDETIFDKLQNQIDDFNQARKEILSHSQKVDQVSQEPSQIQSPKIKQEKEPQEKTPQKEEIKPKVFQPQKQEEPKIQEEIKPQEIPQQTQIQPKIENVQKSPVQPTKIQSPIQKQNVVQNQTFSTKKETKPFIKQSLDCDLSHIPQKHDDLLKENQVLRQSLQHFQSFTTLKSQESVMQEKFNILQFEYETSQKELKMIKEHLDRVLGDNQRYNQQFQTLKNSMQFEREHLQIKVTQLTQQLSDNEIKLNKYQNQYEMQMQKTQQKQDKIESLLQTIQNKDQIIQNLLDLNNQVNQQMNDDLDMNNFDGRSVQRSQNQSKQMMSQYDLQRNYNQLMEQNNFEQKSQKSYQQNSNNFGMVDKQSQRSKNSNVQQNFMANRQYVMEEQKSSQQQNSKYLYSQQNPIQNSQIQEQQELTQNIDAILHQNQHDQIQEQRQENNQIQDQIQEQKQEQQPQQEDYDFNLNFQSNDIHKEAEQADDFSHLHQNQFFNESEVEPAKSITFINAQNQPPKKTQTKHQRNQRFLHQSNCLFQEDDSKPQQTPQNRYQQQETVKQQDNQQKIETQDFQEQATPLKRQNSLTSIHSINSIQTEGNKAKRQMKRVIPNTMFE